MEGVRLPPDILGYARDMRSEPTDAEAKLWYFLRDRRMDGFKFRRQYPVRRYIVDFYCPEAKLAIELDGGQHAVGGQGAYDARRERTLRDAGIRVLRFWDNDALRCTLDVLQEIWDALQKSRHAKDPHPSPLPKGEGG
jgi:very-short-patch-repair endonuclease